MENLIEYTNARLIDWYANVKREYGVIGHGYSKYNIENNEVEIYYTEDGVNCLFKQYYHPDFKLNTIFDIWSTEASIENDKIN